MFALAALLHSSILYLCIGRITYMVKGDTIPGADLPGNAFFYFIIIKLMVFVCPLVKYVHFAFNYLYHQNAIGTKKKKRKRQYVCYL